MSGISPSLSLALHLGFFGTYLDGQDVSTWRASIDPSAANRPSTITSRPAANISGLGSPRATTRNSAGSTAETDLTGEPSGLGGETIAKASVSVAGSQLIVPALTRPATRSIWPLNWAWRAPTSLTVR